MCVHAHAAAAGLKIQSQSVPGWDGTHQRVFGINATFDGVTFDLNVTLRMLQRLAHRQQDLIAHEINARDFPVTGCST